MALLLGTAWVLAGCAAEQATIRPSASAALPAADAGTRCTFHIEALEDARGTQDLGGLGRTRIDGEQFVPWFRKELAAMPGHRAQGAPVRLRIALARAYIQGVSSMKSVNIVMKVHGAGTGRATLEKVYRGVHSSINWSNSESEVQEAFRDAAADLRRQLADDLPPLCGMS